jgi:hypothetical protein
LPVLQSSTGCGRLGKWAQDHMNKVCAGHALVLRVFGARACHWYGHSEATPCVKENMGGEGLEGLLIVVDKYQPSGVHGHAHVCECYIHGQLVQESRLKPVI